MLSLFFFFTLLGGIGCRNSPNDERNYSIAAGHEFLNDDRIEQWEKYFTDGLPKLGKIKQSLSGSVSSIAWIEKNYRFVKSRDRDGVICVAFSNPDYGATVEFDEGVYKVRGVGAASSPDKIALWVANPIACCSVVTDSTERLIPRFLQEGKLKISNYRHEDQKHFVELEFTVKHDEVYKGGKVIELIFYDNNPSLLPNEAIFYREMSNRCHYVCTDFKEIEGYHFPLKMQLNMIGNDGMTCEIEVSPEDPLNKEMCYLAHYGLPEPEKLPFPARGTETDTFAPIEPEVERKAPLSWQTIIFWSSAALGVVSGMILWFQKKYSKGN